MSFYSFAKGVCSLVLKIKGYKVKGLENVPADGPFIVACNHISLWDPVVVGCTLPRQVFFMAKDGLFKVPVLRKILEWLGTFPVKRGQADIGAIKKSLTVLKRGQVLGIFPEGTRSKTGNIQVAMAGIVIIMEKSQVPILPVKVYGSVQLLKQKRGNMGIIIGKPIYAYKIDVPADVEDRRTWLAQKIMNEVDQI